MAAYLMLKILILIFRYLRFEFEVIEYCVEPIKREFFIDQVVMVCFKSSLEN